MRTNGTWKTALHRWAQNATTFSSRGDTENLVIAIAAPILHNLESSPARRLELQSANMDRLILHQLLRDLRFSADLSDASAAKLGVLVSARDYPRGAQIFAEGAENPWLYLVAEGQVALEMCIPARGCTRILTLGAGDLLAWSSLLGNGLMTAGAQALTDVRLLAAPAQALKNLCANDRDFAAEFYREVAKALAKRLVATRLQLLDLYGDVLPTATPATSNDA